MNPIDRFFLWVNRYSDAVLAYGFAASVIAVWGAMGAFAIGAYLVLR